MESRHTECRGSSQTAQHNAKNLICTSIKLCVVACMMLLVGCIAKPPYSKINDTSALPQKLKYLQSQPLPSDIAQARREVQYLQEILYSQQQLADMPSKREHVDRSTQSGRFAPPPPSRKHGRPYPRDVEHSSGQNTATPAQARQHGEAPSRCFRICRAAKSIRASARRICDIARRFPQEGSFHTACQQANQDSQDATHTCKICK